MAAIFPIKLQTSKYHDLYAMDISYICLHFQFYANPANSFRSKGFLRKMNYQLTQLAQVKYKLISKYQCGNDLDCSRFLKIANKYAKFDDPNRNG